MIAIILPTSISFAKSVVEGFSGEIREDVKFDPFPDDYDVWPDGQEAPHNIIGESETDPGHYHLFKYEWEITGSGFRTTGKTYGGSLDVHGRWAAMAGGHEMNDGGVKGRGK